MRRDLSFPIGRVCGIQLRVHVTFFLIVLLFALGSTAPGGPGLLGGMVWLVIIFTCVLIHELSHSLVARRRGATVKGIVLLPIGGVSQLENLPESPSDEFAIAVVGPLASFAVGAVAAVAAAALKVPLWPIDLYNGPLLPRTAWFNVIIGAFNLLPAFPMDGGRVLRSLLERRMSLEAATRLAARIGRVFAGLMVVGGVFFNIWFVLIGLFVFFGASSEEAATIIHARIKDLLVRDVMVTDPATVDASTPVGYILDMTRHTSQREFPVIEAGRYVGMAVADALIAVPPQAPVGHVTDRACPAVSPMDPLEKVEVEVLGPSGRPAAAVVAEGRVVGLLTQADIGRLVRRAGSRQPGPEGSPPTAGRPPAAGPPAPPTDPSPGPTV